MKKNNIQKAKCACGGNVAIEAAGPMICDRCGYQVSVRTSQFLKAFPGSSDNEKWEVKRYGKLLTEL